jgi:predicted DCC family thiol-disulfide oxidoreductase YuxK
MSAPTDRPVLLYDGLCGFCDGTVQFILRHDRRGTMQFATLQGELGQRVLSGTRELQGVDSLVMLEGDRVHVKSEAALRIAAYLGGAWRLALVLRLVPRALRDWGYDLFARHRYRFFGKHDSCPIPAPEVRARFIA